MSWSLGATAGYTVPLTEWRLTVLAGQLTFTHLLCSGVPSMAVWLSGFYAIFHCWLNVLAEVTRFADR